MKKIAFTIVLNGMPFIKEQYKVIPHIFDHWYIIEGVSKNINCTRWCNPVAEKYHKNNLSNDGTKEFLDSISHDDNITVIRKPNNGAWAGKVEMCNSFMHLVEGSILMQIDVDEFWDGDILQDIFNHCESKDNFDAMQFRCNYFLGPELVVKSRDSYGDMAWDWWRLWIVRECNRFISHEPPKIQNQRRVITKNDTHKAGWVFDHYAYKYEHQVEFKENFYGYRNAVKQWLKLNSLNCYENVDANDYLSWINASCIVENVNK